MKGLLRNNLYASASNTKTYAAVMLALGLFVVAMDNKVPSLLINYMLISMVGFSVNGVSCMHEENASKWIKYKLTAPVRRSDIVKSYYITHLLWVSIGVLYAAVCVSLSIGLHGFPFDKPTDVLMLFIVGISVSLFMAMLFYPLIYSCGSEKYGVISFLSVLGAIIIVMAIVSLINYLFDAPLTLLQLVISGISLLLFAVICFLLSCPISILIFSRKEY